MNCAQVQHHLDGWVRGEVDGATGEAVAGHIASCAACAAEADLARRIAGGLRGLRTTAPSALVGRILETAPAQAPARRIAWFTPLRALAALFLVAVVVLFSRDRGDLMTPMNPEVIASPAPMLQDAPSAAVPSGPPSVAEAAGAEVSADGAGYAVSPAEAIPAGEARVPAEAPRLAAPRTALRNQPNASAPPPVPAAPAPAAPAPAAPAPAAPAPAPASATAPKAFTSPSAAAEPPDAEPAPVYERATTTGAAGLLATGSYPAAGAASGTARLTSMSTSLEPSGGSATAGGASLAYAEVSVPSRVPEERSPGTKLFLRSFSGDGNGGMTTFTQAHQLRSIARSSFRDTTAPTLTYPIQRR